MKIGIISDTHGDLRCWQEALAGPFAGADYLLHAGDLLYHGPRNPMTPDYDPAALAEAINAAPCPVLIARGNCDSPVDQQVIDWPIQAPYALLALPAITILVGHGDELTEKQMARLGNAYGAALFVHGHTHTPKVSQEGGVMLLNPGSAALPKAGGATPRRSVAVIEEARLVIVSLDDGQVVAREALPWQPGTR